MKGGSTEEKRGGRIGGSKRIGVEQRAPYVEDSFGSLLCFKRQKGRGRKKKKKLEKEQESMTGFGFILAWERQFPHPVLALGAADIDGDGYPELIIGTARGVHVLRAPSSSSTLKGHDENVNHDHRKSTSGSKVMDVLSLVGDIIRLRQKVHEQKESIQ